MTISTSISMSMMPSSPDNDVDLGGDDDLGVEAGGDGEDEIDPVSFRGRENGLAAGRVLT